MNVNISQLIENSAGYLLTYTVKMSILNANHFTFKINFTIMNDNYQLEMSSDKVVEGEEGMMWREVITLKFEERGVSMIMIRRLSDGGESEYGLDGLGLMEGLGEEELRDFAFMWVMVVQRELGVDILALIALDPILNHFFEN